TSLIAMPPCKKRKREACNLVREQGRFISQKKLSTDLQELSIGIREEWGKEFDIQEVAIDIRLEGFDEQEAVAVIQEEQLQESETSNKRHLTPSVNTITQPTSLNFITPTKTITSLQTHFEEVNRHCSFTKSSKLNIPTYDYLRLISVSKFIKLLLDGKGKMDASRQVAESVWNKGDYISRCIRNWGDHFIHTGELIIDRQGKHTKWRGLLDDEDVSEDCQAWLRQQKPEARFPLFLKAYIEGKHIEQGTV
ncbi:13851_t:CDS:2, partial [Cetraspora pellucida]